MLPAGEAGVTPPPALLLGARRQDGAWITSVVAAEGVGRNGKRWIGVGRGRVLMFGVP